MPFNKGYLLSQVSQEFKGKQCKIDPRMLSTKGAPHRGCSPPRVLPTLSFCSNSTTPSAGVDRVYVKKQSELSSQSIGITQTSLVLV